MAKNCINLRQYWGDRDSSYCRFSWGYGIVLQFAIKKKYIRAWNTNKPKEYNKKGNCLPVCRNLKPAPLTPPFPPKKKWTTGSLFMLFTMAFAYLAKPWSGWLIISNWTEETRTKTPQIRPHQKYVLYQSWAVTSHLSPGNSRISSFRVSPNLFIYQARQSLAWSQLNFWQSNFCRKHNLWWFFLWEN